MEYALPIGLLLVIAFFVVRFFLKTSKQDKEA